MSKLCKICQSLCSVRRDPCAHQCALMSGRFYVRFCRTRFALRVTGQRRIGKEEGLRDALHCFTPLGRIPHARCFFSTSTIHCISPIHRCCGIFFHSGRSYRHKERPLPLDMHTVKIYSIERDTMKTQNRILNIKQLIIWVSSNSVAPNN